VQHVEGPGTERRRVLGAQLDGEVERMAPEDVDDREPSVANVGIEIGDRGSARRSSIRIP
jgi:hypothetical protein